MSEGENKNIKPTLVVGATGQVGRLCVVQLLDQHKPVRALIRNHEKAKQVFSDDILQNSNLQLIIVDLGLSQECSRTSNLLEQAVKGCDSIISVSGALRFSKITDFLPWRFMNPDVSAWTADTTHPYYCNYQAHCLLIDFAKQYSVRRFVRVTGGTVGYSAFNPFVILMSSVLSLTTQYHFLTERYLRESGVPYVTVRPGGLMNGDRIPSTTFVQVDTTCCLPPPCYVYRSDVAELCVAVCQLLIPTESYTMCIRAVGDIGKNKKRQGTKFDGHATVCDCLIGLQGGERTELPRTKPYRLAVGVVVYGIMAGVVGATYLIGVKVSRK